MSTTERFDQLLREGVASFPQTAAPDTKQQVRTTVQTASNGDPDTQRYDHLFYSSGNGAHRTSNQGSIGRRWGASIRRRQQARDDGSIDGGLFNKEYNAMCRCAVDRSQGQLVDLTNDALMDYIANRFLHEIDGTTETDYTADELLLHAIDAFNATVVLVLGQAKANVDVVKLQKSGGVVSRNAKVSQKARGSRIRICVFKLIT
ncbi:hypothetical protein SASPL_119236 [Salvia splendens]|uniref:Uncharacterized protein n=1 Tax=Salvia splendens TaxID=180675 RepID=A0A8X8ZUH7_SALSN|nr:hypothetical protein SASPL_119236 [Salvia splendens]